jgi:hypothetical protein
MKTNLNPRASAAWQDLEQSELRQVEGGGFWQDFVEGVKGLFRSKESGTVNGPAAGQLQKVDV